MGILTTMPFATIEEAIADFQAGRMVIIVDDEDRDFEDLLDDSRGHVMAVAEISGQFASAARGLSSV